jgi:hypothetical protein
MVITTRNVSTEKLFSKFPEIPRDYIEELIKLGENCEAHKFLIEHERYTELLVDCMIGAAQEDDEICIYSGTLTSKCYKDALNTTLSRRIRILVDTLPEAKATIDSLAPSQRDKIKYCPVGLTKSDHFFTVGSSWFRYELNHGKTRAMANFGDSETVTALNARFDGMWAEATARFPTNGQNTTNLSAPLLEP